MKISVITWDANFRENIHTIHSFAEQTFDSEEFEFVWVDYYHSNEQVQQEISKFHNACLVTLENPPNSPWHLGKCINTGVQKSSGEILIIPDGDIIVERDFISYLFQAHQKCPDLVQYFYRYDEMPRANSRQAHPSISYLQKQARLTNPTNYAGCFSLRRENFQLIRGYETHEVFTGPGINGMETHIRLRNAGMAIRWSADKKVFHPWHPSSGSAGHNMRKALLIASLTYPWIIPYAGLEQSWLVYCRGLSGDIVADKRSCEKYLAQMPRINMSYYKIVARLIFSKFFSQFTMKTLTLLRQKE